MSVNGLRTDTGGRGPKVRSLQLINYGNYSDMLYLIEILVFSSIR